MVTPHGTVIDRPQPGNRTTRANEFLGQFQSDQVMSPYCYRCPFNKAKPERDDARNYRQCNWECTAHLTSALNDLGDSATAVVMEPRVQGAA